MFMAHSNFITDLQTNQCIPILGEEFRSGSRHSQKTVSGLNFQMLVEFQSFLMLLLLASIFIELWLENVVHAMVLCDLS